MKNAEIKNLVQRLNSPREEDRLYAAEDLGNLPDDGIYELLTDCLKKETSQIVKDSILNKLKSKLSGKLFPEIFELFYSEDAYIRNAAVSIFSYGGDNSITYLESRFNSSNKEVKKLILDTLFEIDTPNAGRVISSAIWDEAPNVKITAIEYIGRLGLENSREDILTVFEKEEEPMLILSILMSLLFFEDFNYLNRITKRLCPQGNIKKINGIYMGEYLKLIAKFGEKKEILDVIIDMHDDKIYSYEIIDFLKIATIRFRELIDDQAMKDLLITYLKNPVKEEKIIYNLFHIMNKSNDPKIIKITEVFLDDPESGIADFFAGVVQELISNKE